MKKNFSPPQPHYIVDELGNKTEVILDIKSYDQLIELIEDFSLSKMALQVKDSELFSSQILKTK